MPARSLAAALVALALTGAACSGGEGADSTTTTSQATTSTAPPPTTTSTVPGELVLLDDLQVGECWDEAQDVEEFQARRIDCALPHENQVYAVFDWEGDEEAYPGELAVKNQAEERCLAAFEPWVGLAWERSTLDLRTHWPTAASWDEGDRRLMCSVYSFFGEPLEGSVEGSAR